MKTIADIQSSLRTFDDYARSHDDDPSAIQNKWKSLFQDVNINNETANAFASYYREMRSKSRRISRRGMRGGSYSPAPLSYQMTPGANVAVYGRFPVEADTDPSTLRDLDVFWKSGLTGTCGSTAAYWPTVPADMGSNKVGGGRSGRSRRHKKTGRRTLRGGRRGRRGTRRMRGGNLLESLMSRPVMSTVPPNALQIGFHNASGGVPPMPVPSSPVNHTWQYMSSGTTGLINPGVITPISSDMTKLASPAPWQTAN